MATMRFRYSILLYTSLVLLAAAALQGCSTTRATSRQLARVAKDWSLVIRASQVIPVYPLTEDLQPGDVFLVRTPIEQQIGIYESKGFLPMENLLTRLQPSNYQSFYLSAYDIDGHTDTPHHWQFPGGLAKGSGWTNAPRAAFPSYTFSVQRGAGLNLAVPVEGVPVALSLLGAGKAHGDITIADAYTYGVDMQSMHQSVKVWAEQDKNREYLRQFSGRGKNKTYLRVVNRVYLTGRVHVSVSSDEAYGASVSGGASKPVDLLSLKPQDASGNYTSAITALSKTVEAATPGGTLKLAAASSRSVSLVETFPRPLVIGYIGFDLPVLADGQLGSPVSTRARLSKEEMLIQVEAEQQIREEDEMIARIVGYVKDEQGNAVGAKLQTLMRGTGLTQTWVEKFDGKPVTFLESDLKGPHNGSVRELAQNLSKSP